MFYSIRKKFFIVFVQLVVVTTLATANNCPKWLPMPMTDGLHVVIPIYDESITGADLDCDEILDNVDTDIDGDGVANSFDSFPLNSSEWVDTDGDGIGNNADMDDDGDGYSDVIEAANDTDSLDENSIPRPFIITVKTDNQSLHTSDTEFKIPTKNGVIYNYDVDCNSDGIVEESNIIGDYTCEYDIIGEYNITISGKFPHIYFNDSGDDKKLISIVQWGTQKWESFESAFYGCFYMHLDATDIPNMTSVTSMHIMFGRTANLEGGLSLWDTSNVEDMSFMFFDSRFNNDISAWNTLNVKDMRKMFYINTRFNQPLGDWDTSKVENMEGMFYFTANFDQNISAWNTSKVTTMKNMFYHAHNFNHPIGDWNTSAVTDMSHMFTYAKVFNQEIGGWDTSEVTDMNSTFEMAHNFNQDIGSWKVSKVKGMAKMFLEAREFNQDIGSWDVNEVTTMYKMFRGSEKFNAGIEEWDISKVTNMSGMFMFATNFNKDIGLWEAVSSSGMKVENMSSMFYGATAFNGDISDWDTSHVTDMSNMFKDAVAFNGDVSFWTTSSVTIMYGMFDGASTFSNHNLSSWDVNIVGNHNHFSDGWGANNIEPNW